MTIYVHGVYIYGYILITGREKEMRLATRAQNRANTPKLASSRQPYKGVSKQSKGSRWQARIRVNGANKVPRHLSFSRRSARGLCGCGEEIPRTICEDIMSTASSSTAVHEGSSVPWEASDSLFPITLSEAAALHDRGWQSGYGWKTQADWYWEPERGTRIWPEDDPEIGRRWEADLKGVREAIHAARVLEAKRKAGPDLYAALIELLAHCDRADFSNGVTDPTGSIDEGEVRASEAMARARSCIAKIGGADQ